MVTCCGKSSGRQPGSAVWGGGVRSPGATAGKRKAKKLESGDSMEPATRFPEPGPLSGSWSENSAQGPMVKFIASTGEQPVVSVRQLSYAEVDMA
jgi:hypothetical protein